MSASPDSTVYDGDGYRLNVSWTMWARWGNPITRIALKRLEAERKRSPRVLAFAPCCYGEAIVGLSMACIAEMVNALPNHAESPPDHAYMKASFRYLGNIRVAKSQNGHFEIPFRLKLPSGAKPYVRPRGHYVLITGDKRLHKDPCLEWFRGGIAELCSGTPDITSLYA